MGGDGVKAGLPHPYNLDLSGVLRRLDRRTEAGRARLANDPVTAAYLAAGMRLIEHNLGPGPRRAAADPAGEAPVRPVLAFLSQRAVAAEMEHNPHPFHRAGSTGTLRSTWRSQSDYIADLIGFGLWSQQYPVAKHGAELAAARRALVTGGDFVDAVHGFCYWVVTTLAADPTFRLGLLAAAVAEDDEAITRAVADHYQTNRTRWDEIYREILAAHGLSLRPGIDLDDIGRMLTALAEGFALRGLADPAAPVVDHERRRTLLGTAALALILSFGEPTGAVTLDAAVTRLISRNGAAR
jgi:BetI-type transcriptional repressor, C-terminal